MFRNFIALILTFFIFINTSFAGLPPTTSKVSGDASNLTTFNYQFPNFTGTHTGITVSLGVNGIAGGGTGAITKAAAFDALSPMTTGGDLIYGGASGTGTRLANGSSGQVLTSAGGTSAPTWASAPSPTYAPPTAQRFTSSSGTYNKSYTFVITSGSANAGATYTNNSITYTVNSTISSQVQVVMRGSGAPAASGTLTKASGTGDSTLTFSQVLAPLYLKVKLIGGGGGGYGNNNSGTPGAGGDSTFGSLVTASGATGGGNGGTTTVNNPAVAIVQATGGFGIGQTALVTSTGGMGASSPLGGAGQGGIANAGPGLAAVTNSGSGGGGGSGTATTASGQGGAAGGYAEIIVIFPSATYSYAVGAGGAGATGTNVNGGAGGSGVVMVEEHYQ
jgi:hypothetical protein